MPIANVGTETQILGARQRVYCMPQTAGGTKVDPLGSDPTESAGGPLRVLSTDFQVARPTEVHEFSQDGAGPFLGQQYNGMTEIPWTIRTPIIPPSNLVGTIMPEFHHLLVSIMGSVTVVGGTSITYNLAAKSRAALLTLCRIANFDDRILGEWLVDAVPDMVKFSWSSGESPEFEFTGQAKTHIGAGFTTLSGGMSSSTSMPITHANALDVGAIVSIAAGSPFEVTAMSSDGLTATIDTAATAPTSSEVRPFAPDPTYSGIAAFAKTEGSVTIGGVARPITGLTWQLGLNSEFITSEIGSSSMTDAPPGQRDITGEVTIRATESEVRNWVARKQTPTLNISTTLGDGATGRSGVISMPTCKPDVSSISMDGKNTTLSFRAFDATEGGNDALSFALT